MTFFGHMLDAGSLFSAIKMKKRPQRAPAKRESPEKHSCKQHTIKWRKKQQPCSTMENSLHSHSSPGVKQLELILYDIRSSKGDPPKDKR